MIEKLIPFYNIGRFARELDGNDSKGLLKIMGSIAYSAIVSVSIATYLMSVAITKTSNPIRQLQIVQESREDYDYFYSAVKVAADKNGNGQIDFYERKDMYAKMGLKEEDEEVPSMANLKSAIRAYQSESNKLAKRF